MGRRAGVLYSQGHPGTLTIKARGPTNNNYTKRGPVKGRDAPGRGTDGQVRGMESPSNFQKNDSIFATPWACYRGLSGPSGPKCLRECRRECPRKPGCLRECLTECPKKCPESAPGVSKRCPRHSADTLGTLFGHSEARGPKGPGDTPWDTPGRHPGFRGHSRRHSRRHFGPEARDPCSRPRGSQTLFAMASFTTLVVRARADLLRSGPNILC